MINFLERDVMKSFLDPAAEKLPKAKFKKQLGAVAKALREEGAKAGKAYFESLARSRTGYDTDGVLRMAKLVLTTPVTQITRDTREVGRIVKKLEGIDMPVTKDNWQEITDDWLIIHSLQETTQSTLAKFLLEQVFTSEAIRRGVGVARQLRDISGQPPEGLVKLLKLAKADLKKHLENYLRAADH